MKVGYARVSSTGQNLESQIQALKNIGCQKIFQEKKSGKQQDNRNELQNALDYVREGDEFYVTRLDRCSRSVKDLHEIIDKLSSKGVSFKATEQDLDTSTSTGRLMIGLLSIISAFETDLRAERQADGIKSAKDRGVEFGRKKKLTDTKVKEIIKLQQTGTMTNLQIAEKYNVGKSTLLRDVAKYKDSLTNINRYIKVDYNLNPLNSEDKVYEKLISKHIEVLHKAINELIEGSDKHIFKNIDFKTDVTYEVLIKSGEPYIRIADNIENNPLLDNINKFIDSTRNVKIDTSVLVFEEPPNEVYDEFGFEEMDK